MPEPTLAQHLARFAAETRLSGAPRQVRENVELRILDVLGIAIAATDLQTSLALLGFVGRQGGGNAAAIVGADGDGSSAAWAAFANGVLAHSLDFDDTHLPSVLHPSAVVVPAALAVGESLNAHGSAVLDAVAVGIETTIRVGMAGYDSESRNSTFFEHGQHATSICGTIGAAVAAAMLYDLDADGIVDAMGIAASMGSGILEANRMGGTVKRAHCGWAAHAGVVAADLARSGITGPPTVLEGRFGFYQAFLHGRFDSSAVTNGLGSTWEVPGVFFKPYPANHFTHAAADAVMDLRRDGLRPGDVEWIRVGVAAPTIRTIGEPIEGKRRPATGYQAQFSGPYVVAAALIGGGGLGLCLEDFDDDLVSDPGRIDLMDRITIESDSRCDEVYPYQFPAVVDVMTKNGTQLSASVFANRGGPENPLTTDELTLKFKSNARRHLDEASIDAVADACRELGSVSDVGSVIRAINTGWVSAPSPATSVRS